MASANTLKEWWTKALLGEQLSAHPIVGRDIDVSVDGNVVTLTGEVGTAEERAVLEQEARRLASVDSVVNRLQVAHAIEPQRLQTVIAVFDDRPSAQMAQQVAQTWKLHQGEPPRLLDDPAGLDYLESSAAKAGLSGHETERYTNAVQDGKVLLIDRVPEDEAFRLISGFEGTDAQSIHTLPPEPVAAPPLG